MTTDAREKRLTEAVSAALSEYYADHDSPTFIVDWMIVTSEMDPTRDNTSGVGMFYQNGVMSWITALGLAEAARLRLQAGWMDGMIRDD